MVDDGVLRIPIQINGGNNLSGVTLKDRELFLDSRYGILYYGSGNSTTPTRLGVQGNDIIKFDLRGDTAVFGGLVSNKVGSLYKLSPVSTLGDYGVQLDKVKLGSLVLANNGNYGNTLPSSGVEGQIFFLIP